MKFDQFILEGQNENNAKAKLKKAGKEDIFDTILSITEPYKGTNEGKNNKHLPKLVDFYLDGTNLEHIKAYYDRFIKNPKLANKPIDKLSFDEFEQLVDSTATKQDIEDKSIDEKPIYEDDNVKIFLGDSKPKCIKYGQGRKYGFCIARQDNSNLFHGYRSRGASFYFVYFKNREAQGSAPENLIVIHAYPDDRYQINYSTPNEDHNITKEEIISQFPVLDPIFDKVIVHKPLSDKESYIYKHINNARSIDDLKTLDDKLLYIEMGKYIKDWTNYKTNDEIIKKYIEVGSHDIPDEVIAGTKYEDRYYDKLRDRIEIKSENIEWTHSIELFDQLTQDEQYVWVYDQVQDDKINWGDKTLMINRTLGSTGGYNPQLFEFLLEQGVKPSDYAIRELFYVQSSSPKDIKDLIKVFDIIFQHIEIPLSITYLERDMERRNLLPLSIYDKVIDETADQEGDNLTHMKNIYNFLTKRFDSDEREKAVQIAEKLIKRYTYEETRDGYEDYYIETLHDYFKSFQEVGKYTEIYKILANLYNYTQNRQHASMMESFNYKLKILFHI